MGRKGWIAAGYAESTTVEAYVVAADCLSPWSQPNAPKPTAARARTMPNRRRVHPASPKRTATARVALMIGVFDSAAAVQRSSTQISPPTARIACLRSAGRKKMISPTAPRAASAATRLRMGL